MGQVPQVPPQPSGPHFLLVQFGVQLLGQLHQLQVLPLQASVPPVDLHTICPHTELEGQILPAQLGHVGWQMHVPDDESHMLPVEQLPHEPPQPSSPQALPLQIGVQEHQPLASQVFPVAQLPQEPPHPSGPQTFPVQLGTHLHWPLASQVLPVGQVPQEPPQPSGPHCLPLHLRMHPSGGTGFTLRSAGTGVTP
jgi:hypothetical protein